MIPRPFLHQSNPNANLFRISRVLFTSFIHSLYSLPTPDTNARRPYGSGGRRLGGGAVDLLAPHPPAILPPDRCASLPRLDRTRQSQRQHSRLRFPGDLLRYRRSASGLFPWRYSADLFSALLEPCEVLSSAGYTQLSTRYVVIAEG